MGSTDKRENRNLVEKKNRLKKFLKALLCCLAEHCATPAPSESARLVPP